MEHIDYSFYQSDLTIDKVTEECRGSYRFLQDQISWSVFCIIIIKLFSYQAFIASSALMESIKTANAADWRIAV